ncbi:biotin--protein ligase-like [Oculina patagonica]
MPLLGAGWLSGYAVTKVILKLTSSCARVAVSRKPARFPPLTSSDGKSSKLTGHVTQTIATISSKPPNILIYTGCNDADDKKFSIVKQALTQVLNLHSYVIYRLHEQQVTSHPWIENTALLVLGNNDPISSKVQQAFVKYLRGGGQILGLCGPFTCQVIKKPWDDHFQPFIASVKVNHQELLQEESQQFSALCEPFYFEGDQTKIVAVEETSKRPVIIQVSEGLGNAVFSLVHLELFTDDGRIHDHELDAQSLNLLKQSSDARINMLSQILQLLGMTCLPRKVPELTPIFLLANKLDKQKLFHSLRSSLKEGVCHGKELSLHFVPNGETIPKTTDKTSPVVSGEDDIKDVSFDWKKYQDHLQTKVLGQMVFYTDVITSTQTVFDGNYTFAKNIPEDLGIVVVAGQQMKGQGRGGNVWLSPAGCMMFSLHVRIPFASKLGQRPPYLQHIASLAAVEAIRSQPGYEDIKVCLKWPNDIYFGQKIKIGGVIVTSSATAGTLSAVIGMGINITNQEPTISVNEIIAQYNKDHKTNLKSLTVEETLARTVNNVEALIEDFQENGSGPFLKKYYNRWLHSDVKVSLSVNDKMEEVTIKGLDDFGFLLVRTKSGESISVQPDGNSFDMLRNLIAMKKS